MISPKIKQDNKNRKRICELDQQGWARLLGTTDNEFDSLCGNLMGKFDFRYEVIGGIEQEAIILNVLKTMDDNKLSVSGRDRKNEWEAGWSENLNDFLNNRYSIDCLTPRYMHKHEVKRLFGRYIRPIDTNFEVNFYTVYRHYLFLKYLADYDPIMEFGCGTGYNLVILAKLFPSKKIIGLDWTKSSIDLIETIADKYDLNIHGQFFNFFEPDKSLVVPNGSAFLTLNALEQTGRQYGFFLDFILEKRPAICINSEPFVEMYDPNYLLDYLAIRYHNRRNYLKGFIPSLQNLDKENKLSILSIKKVPFGNLFHEGYSFVVWKPK